MGTWFHTKIRMKPPSWHTFFCYRWVTLNSYPFNWNMLVAKACGSWRIVRTSISVSNAISSVFNLQLIAESSRMAPPNRPPLFFPQRFFLLKETQCPHWPPLVPVVSSSLVRFQCCVAASDGKERQNLEIKGHHKAIEGTSWLGIRFCCKKSDVYNVIMNDELYLCCTQAVWKVWNQDIGIYKCFNRLYSHVEKICTEMLWKRNMCVFFGVLTFQTSPVDVSILQKCSWDEILCLFMLTPHLIKDCNRPLRSTWTKH